MEWQIMLGYREVLVRRNVQIVLGKTIGIGDTNLE
jgi:hypothetical protein